MPILVKQSAQLAVRLPAIYREYRIQWMGSPSRIIRLEDYQLPSINFLDSAASDVGEINPLDQVNSLVAFTGRTVEGLFSFLALMLLTYYWTLESERTLRGLLLWIPS